MLKQLYRRITETSGFPLPAAPSGLWLDHSGAEERIASLEDDWLRGHMQRLSEDGYTLLEANIPGEVCDQIRTDFQAFCEQEPRHNQFQDQAGLHSRLCNFHLESESARRVGFDPNVLRVLDCAFDRRTAVISSLLFERGSAQRIHRDGPFFYTNPPNLFFGVWTALEDIEAGSGELLYFRGGHRVAARKSRRGYNWGEYCEDVSEECRRRNLPLEPGMFRKGDTLIWHPELPHGGGERKLTDRTRWSLVFHYLPENTPIAGIDSFFRGRAPMGSPAMVQEPQSGRSYVPQSPAHFELNDY